MTSPMVLQLAMTRGYAVCGAPLSATICILCTEVALNTGLFTNFERKAGNIIMKNYEASYFFFLLFFEILCVQ